MGFAIPALFERLEDRTLLATVLPSVSVATSTEVMTSGSAWPTFTASVASVFAGGPTATGTVTFYLGSNPVGGVYSYISMGTATLSGGTATLTPSSGLNTPPVGEHAVYVSYSGDANYTAASSLQMRQAVGNTAGLNQPRGEAFDPIGNMYIADSINNVIRKVDKATGANSIFAGTGTQGYTGDGGQATAATLFHPYALAFDSSGNLYVSDNGNNVVREVLKATGTIVTVAGNGSTGYAGDGGPATSAKLGGPRGLAFDLAGNLYIAGNPNSVVREVIKATGNIVTVAGKGTAGYTGDGGPATASAINSPTDIAFDAGGDLYIADDGNHVVREIVKGTGNIVTVAGTGVQNYTGDGGLATAATMSSPLSLAVDSLGDIFIADVDTNTVREVIKATGRIVTVAGVFDTDGGSSSNGTIATSAHMDNVRGLVFDASGRLYIADAGNGLIQQVSPPAYFVSQAVTTTSFITSSPSTLIGQTLAFTATVGPSNATGTVTFKDGNAIIGMAPVSGGHATFSTSSLAMGSHSITAVYGGDVFDASSTSSVVTVNVGSTLIVTNTNDSGPGSLRQAILDADAATDTQGVPLVEIDFAISGDDPGYSTSASTYLWTIRPTSALPSLSRPILINGASEVGYSPATLIPVIELSGNLAGAGASGLILSGGGGSVIRGLEIDRFSANGISITSNNNRVISSWIGIGLNSSNAVITGIGNGSNGILISAGASNNWIGANAIGGVETPGQRNVISQNAGSGVFITGAGTTGNHVDGNYLGLDPSGTRAFGNGQTGTWVDSGASGNTIGGTNSIERNIIAGNGVRGVYVRFAAGNTVEGNYVGTDRTGLIGLGNGSQDAISVDTSSNTTIVGNVLDGAKDSGIFLYGNAQEGPDAASSGVVIAGNIIGLGADGVTASPALSNTKAGITIETASGTTIGGTTLAARNIISNNIGPGILTFNFNFADGVYGTVIQGNYIGTDLSGTLERGNAIGIDIEGSSTVLQNSRPSVLIGTDGSGPADVDAREGNVIAGNLGDGVRINGSSSSRNSNTSFAGANYNVVAGNFIGTNFDAQGNAIAGLGNGGIGVNIIGGASNNWIGVNPISSAAGENSTQRNIISGNNQAYQAGIALQGAGTSNNVVAGNYVGTDKAGTVAVANWWGVYIGLKASSNLIGTDGNGSNDDIERNVLSGNIWEGVFLDGSDPNNNFARTSGTTGNLIAGNFIGTDATGSKPLGNGLAGVKLYNGPSGNTIGGTTAALRNVIAASTYRSGIDIIAASANTIVGNWLGVNFDASGNAIAGLGNAMGGVGIEGGSSNNIIGAVGAGNIIASNVQGGVGIIVDSGNPSVGNTIRFNSIYGNGGVGIDLNDDGFTPNDTGDVDSGPNTLLNFPVILVATYGSSTAISGTYNGASSKSFTLDFYAIAAANPSGSGAGSRYLGSLIVTTDSVGNASYSGSLGATSAGEHIVATATDASGDTSEFSRAFSVQQQSGTTLSSSGVPSTYGQLLTITATVSPSDATGLVKFYDGTTLLASAAVAGGVASYGLSTLSAGTHSITAVYGGDLNYAPSTSAVLLQFVNKVNTTTTLTSSANPIYVGGNITFTATVDSATATGSVIFKDGDTTLGTVALVGGTASYTPVMPLSIGDHSITASYNGDTNDTPSTSAELVQQILAKSDTTTTLTSSANPAFAGGNITFTATLTPPDATGSVIFKDGGTTLGTVAIVGGTAYYSTANLAGGSHAITAQYGGDVSHSPSTSVILNQVVTKIDTSTTLAVSASPPLIGPATTLTATVSPSDATGSVTFSDIFNGTVFTLDTLPLTGGVATLIAANESSGVQHLLSQFGRHIITADYSGDANHTASTTSTAIVVSRLVVTNTNDSGFGSLRQAILDADAKTDTTAFPVLEIDFAIPAGGLGYSSSTNTWTISPTSALPSLTRPTILDGTSQPGYSSIAHRPVIELSGNLAGVGVSGFTLAGTGNDLIKGFVIDRFDTNGITITSNNNRVESSWIGVNVDVAGAVVTGLGNGLDGVRIEQGFTNNWIGVNSVNPSVAENKSQGNVISGNSYGVSLIGSIGSVVAGNLIGLDPSGVHAVGNTDAGIHLVGDGNRIGTDGNGIGDSLEGNVIGGGSNKGILIEEAATKNTVAGNTIGAGPGLGNITGIWIEATASNNTIGGAATVMGNIIAYSTNRGVAAYSNSAPGAQGFGNTIRLNSIHDNGTLGIDLGGDGVTLNDTGDADLGPNGFLNFPIILVAGYGTSTPVYGTYAGGANKTLMLDFYASAQADPTGYGEGARYLGSLTVTTDGGGNAMFTGTLGTTSPGEVIAATATDTDGSTSEFSRAVALARSIDTTPPVSAVGPLPSIGTSLSFPVSVTGHDPATPLATGIVSYDIYVASSAPGGAASAFVYWTTITSPNTSVGFTGQSNRIYAFYSRAKDAAGNVESKSKTEASIYLPDLDAPATSVNGASALASPSSVNVGSGTFTLNLAGTDSGGSGLASFKVSVSVDGAAPRPIGSAIPAGGADLNGVYHASLSYQGIADGQTHSYRFYSVGGDGAGNVEAAPATPGDVVFNQTFAIPTALQTTAFSVQHGSAGRSFIQYLDLTFNENNAQSGGAIQNLISSQKITLYKSDINGNGRTLIPLGATLSVIDHVLEIDFGANGIGGAPGSPTPDGYYELDTDLGNGVIDVHHFFRLLGDVDGNGMVNDTDINLIGGAVGQSPGTGVGITILPTDVNGDGAVTVNDKTLATRMKNRQIATGLLSRLG